MTKEASTSSFSTSLTIQQTNPISILNGPFTNTGKLRHEAEKLQESRGIRKNP